MCPRRDNGVGRAEGLLGRCRHRLVRPRVRRAEGGAAEFALLLPGALSVLVPKASCSSWSPRGSACRPRACSYRRGWRLAAPELALLPREAAAVSAAGSAPALPGQQPSAVASGRAAVPARRCGDGRELPRWPRACISEEGMGDAPERSSEAAPHRQWALPRERAGRRASLWKIHAESRGKRLVTGPCVGSDRAGCWRCAVCLPRSQQGGERSSAPEGAAARSGDLDTLVVSHMLGSIGISA